MMKNYRSGFIGFLVAFFVTFVVNRAFGLATEDFGDRPISSSTDWPIGTLEAAQSQGRIYSRWVNGSEVCCYAGDTKRFNQMLSAFASIQVPIHQLTVKAGPGEIQSFEGKKIRYDWRLEVMSGFARASLLEDGKSEEALYPKLECHLHNINIDDIILPENVEFVLEEDSRDHPWLAQKVKDVMLWRTAKRKWTEYVESYLVEQRNRILKTWPRGGEPPIGGYVEFQSPRVKNHLGNHKIYIIETNITGISNLYAVSLLGEVNDLRGNTFGSMDGKRPYKNEAFSDFIKQQQIVIPDANTAIETGMFIEELASAASRWMYLKQNSNDFKIFKTWIFNNEWTVGSPSWEWYAEPCKDGWIVSRRYIGPPASIMVPPRWKLDLDENNQIVEVTR